MATILHIEDELEVTEFYKEWFEARGHKVINAHHVHTALEAARKRGYDVVILDGKLDSPYDTDGAIFQVHKVQNFARLKDGGLLHHTHSLS